MSRLSCAVTREWRQPTTSIAVLDLQTWTVSGSVRNSSISKLLSHGLWADRSLFSVASQPSLWTLSGQPVALIPIRPNSDSFFYGFLSRYVCDSLLEHSTVFVEGIMVGVELRGDYSSGDFGLWRASHATQSRRDGWWRWRVLQMVW